MGEEGLRGDYAQPVDAGGAEEQTVEVVWVVQSAAETLSAAGAAALVVVEGWCFAIVLSGQLFSHLGLDVHRTVSEIDQDFRLVQEEVESDGTVVPCIHAECSKAQRSTTLENDIVNAAANAAVTRCEKATVPGVRKPSFYLNAAAIARACFHYKTTKVRGYVRGGIGTTA